MKTLVTAIFDTNKNLVAIGISQLNAKEMEKAEKGITAIAVSPRGVGRQIDVRRDLVAPLARRAAIPFPPGHAHILHRYRRL